MVTFGRRLQRLAGKKGTVVVSWTKGHTSLRALLSGDVTTKAAVMNSMADSAADKGSLSAADMGREQMLTYFAHSNGLWISSIRPSTW